MSNFPKKIPVFPLSNFIIFPNTTVPLNIFEPRYLDMVNDAMKIDKLIGMIQPKNSFNDNGSPKLYDVGCLGKITSFRETDDGRYLIELCVTLILHMWFLYHDTIRKLGMTGAFRNIAHQKSFFRSHAQCGPGPGLW